MLISKAEIFLFVLWELNKGYSKFTIRMFHTKR